MTSSSSTESGCDGSVEDNPDNDVSDDDAIGDISFDRSDNVKDSHVVVLEKNLDAQSNSDDSKASASNISINSPNNNHNIANDQNPIVAIDSSKEMASPTEASDNDIQKTKTSLLIDSIEMRTRSVEGENRAFIDDILKEFDNPESIYIPDNENNENDNGNPNSKCKAFTPSEWTSQNTRRTSGAKASQIIKENSEILEKIMRKRVNSIAGSSGENPVSLEQEQLYDDDNGKKEKRADSKDTVSSNTISKPKPSIDTTSPQKLSHNPDTSPKKETGKVKSISKHYPTVSAMGPVKPQLSKPQLNPVGGMVVQQRSDARIGSQNSTKPITFNPFPNSSRIGQRKSNEVGRKLGLYPSTK